MTATATAAPPGFVSEEPEHCHDCWRVVRAGQAYFPTIEHTVACPNIER